MIDATPAELPVDYYTVEDAVLRAVKGALASDEVDLIEAASLTMGKIGIQPAVFRQ